MDQNQNYGSDQSKQKKKQQDGQDQQDKGFGTDQEMDTE
jgi:hypothetical protein